VLQKFAKDMAMQLDAARSGGGDEAGRDTRVKRHRDNRRLAEARYAGDADLGWINSGIRIGLEVVDEAAQAPVPGPQGAPIVAAARLALIRQPDDAFAQPVIVPLDASRKDGAVAPAFVERLLLPGVLAAEAAEAEAIFDNDRHLAGGVLGHGKARSNFHLDLWKGTVIDGAHQFLGDYGDAAAFSFLDTGHFPGHFGDILG